MQLLCGYGGLVRHIFYIHLCDIYVKNGVELLKIYNMVERGGDGLVMTQSVQICTYFTSFNAKCGSLNAVLLDSSCELSVY